MVQHSLGLRKQIQHYKHICVYRLQRCVQKTICLVCCASFSKERQYHQSCSVTQTTQSNGDTLGYACSS